MGMAIANGADLAWPISLATNIFLMYCCVFSFIATKNHTVVEREYIYSKYNYFLIVLIF